ncbi:LAMI_0F00144g1_1 [Lachancea mirantina]|uniref:LAMI_0F00144g1_1 n=1 Tax=Lachancea mirantina TaxID=1230905 RepID=A0A1G4JV74_9SACH|nr:LAMI_0F00144g1_1 [Lachancea mirantina]
MPHIDNMTNSKSQGSSERIFKGLRKLLRLGSGCSKNHRSQMTKQTVFISGGNRGLGFSLVKAFAQEAGTTVVTTARNPDAAAELQKLSKSSGNIHIVKLDVDSEESINAAGAAIAAITKDLDIFISNSGIADIDGYVLTTKKQNWIKHYTTNALGPILLFQALYPLLEKGKLKKAFFLSTVAASIQLELPIPGSAYGQSKAALNYTVRELALDLKKEGFTIAPLHPGVVGSDMGKEVGEQLIALDPKIASFFDPANVLTPDQSASGLKKVIEGLKPEDTGKFLANDGSELPW